MQSTLIGLTLFAVASVGASGPTVKPGEVQTFKDWTVGCDNGFSCQAVSLMDETAPMDGLEVVLSRSASQTAAVAINIDGDDLKAGKYRVVIDGRLALSGTASADGGVVKVNGVDALRLGRAMAKGRQLTLTDSLGKEIGTVSLAGASAALRYIDAQQNRVGTKAAIVAVGNKMRGGKSVNIPVITARKIAPNDVLPDTAAIVALSESSPCADDRFGSTQDTVYSLGSGPDGARALVLLNCGAGAYNYSSGIYTARRNETGKWTFEPAKFDYGATGFDNESSIPVLVNADWDAANQTLSSYSKGRGIGDCGSSESYVWDGAGFRLTAASFMGECRGSTDWIPTWRANVRLTD